MTPPRRLSLKLGAIMILVWAATTALVIVLRWPFLVAKLTLALTAMVWAVHVIRVMLFNRKI